MSGPVYEGQELVDYLANNLIVSYRAIDNRNGFLSEISLINKGPRDIVGSGWTLFVNHFQYIDTDRFNYNNGHPEMDNQQRIIPQFLLQHMMGNLFMLQPTSRFRNLTTGQRTSMYITGGGPMSAVQYMMPNWYVTAPEASPGILKCTATNNLTFVVPYLHPQQWMTSKDDLYHPYSPEDRYKHNYVENLEKSARQIVPTPLKITESPEKGTLTIDWSTWTIVYTDASAQEAQYLKCKSFY